MKNLLLLSFVTLLFVGCQKENQIAHVVISGSIENPSGEKVTILDGRDVVAELELLEDGTFADTLIVDEGYYTFSHGERSTFYMTPGDELTITVDTKEFDETISYQGIGSEKSNYLAEKYLTDERLSGSASEVYALNEDEFMNKIDALNNAKIELLKTSQNLEARFVDIEEKNLEFEHLLNIQRYPDYHRYYGKNSDYEASSKMTEPLKTIDYFNSEYYSSIENYQSLVKRHFSALLEENDNPEAVIEEINLKGSQELKNDFSASLKFNMRPSNEKNEMLYSSIMNLSNDDELKAEINTKYEKLKLLNKGMPSPVFTKYENHKGGTTSLDELKGKYVYIDVWATWCAPCIREIPSLKEIEADYHGKNIEFVSTSIDKAKDHEKWVNMVNDKELGGVQVMADKDWKSQFVQDYAIEGIPRFILIDPEGNIVTGDAPRPSSPDLLELFDELGI